MKKTILLALFIVALLTFTIAISDKITTWNTGNEKENLTYTGTQNKTIQIDIPIYAHVNSFKINVTGYNAT